MKKILVLSLLLLLLTGCSDQKIDQTKDYSSNLKDGTYEVSSAYYDSYGYRKELEISVNQGIISEVNFKEFSKNGSLRIDNPSAQKWPTSQLSYSQIVSNLYEQTIFKQGNSIDTISGATKTCSDYELMLNTLVEKALIGNTQKEVLDSFNDTYILKNEVDPLTGNQEELTVVYNNGEIESVIIKELSANKDQYVTQRAYSSLASLTETNKNLEPITSSNVDPTIINRYNELLDRLKTIRAA